MTAQYSTPHKMLHTPPAAIQWLEAPSRPPPARILPYSLVGSFRAIGANAFWNSFGSASAMIGSPRRHGHNSPVEGAPLSAERRQSNERPVADDRFDRIGRDRFIACRMVRVSGALWPKTSAKAPPQEPCPRSRPAKARARKLARRRWRRGSVGGVARSGGAISRELGDGRLRPLAQGWWRRHA
jgi:hypothetical protein